MLRVLSYPALIIAFLVQGAACQDSKTDNFDFQSAREEMVKSQIAAREIYDEALLDAMRKVERHLFVPDEFKKHAYEDTPLPIGYDQTISQPYIVGLMTSQLVLDGDEKVLEVGTGSGYQAAILGELAREVYTIEIVEPLGQRAAALLDSLGYDNVHVRIGDGFAGWPEEAPFDAIIVTCAPSEVPQPLLDQLAAAGRMIIPVGDYFQELRLLVKKGDSLTTYNVAPVRFVPMTGEGVEKRK